MVVIKFYSVNDYANGSVLQKIEEFFLSEKQPENINDMIGIYNIKQYFDHKLYLLKWTAEKIEKYEYQVSIYYETVARFFTSLEGVRFEEVFKQVNRQYVEDFWILFEKFKVYTKIDDKEFKKVLNKNISLLSQLLKRKILVRYFGNVIKENMLNNHSSAELFIDEYEMQHIVKKDPLYFPIELTAADKEAIINNYIESDNPNLNYLRLIVNIQSNKDKIVLSPRTLLNAKKRAEEEETKFFSENSGMVVETIVSFSKIQDDPAFVKYDESSLSASYSTKWLQENMEYATLWNNFIYLFEFVDNQIRCTFVNKPNQIGALEKMLISRSRNAYLTGVAFNQLDEFSLMQTYGYYNQLFQLGIRLEFMVEWFFTEYLSLEFQANDFSVSMPSTHSTILEKCTSIMPAIEWVLKQFSLYTVERVIDFEILQMQSEHLIYDKIPSLVSKKYVYGVGGEFDYATFLLFSDQSGLGYLEKDEDSYTNCYELLRIESPQLNDFPEYCISKIEWLVEKCYLKKDEADCVYFYDEPTIKVLWDLYHNEVITYWHVSPKQRNALEKLEAKKVVFFESSLFSRAEQDYINYTLNKSKFNNGLDLRNRYSHTQPRGTDNEENIHHQNYMIFLRLLVLFVIKINDDFCISDAILKGTVRNH
jgi:hypothetical protein